MAYNSAARGDYPSHTLTTFASTATRAFACDAPVARQRTAGHSGLVAKKRWNELSPSARRLILIGAGFEGVLKLAALADLVRRPAEQIRGSKRVWAFAIVVVSSVGAVPIAYFAYGRKRS